MRGSEGKELFVTCLRKTTQGVGKVVVLEELRVVVVGAVVVVVVVLTAVFSGEWEYHPLGMHRNLPKTAEQYVAARNSDRR